eukprot:gnl/MRDRNA2_/MRDRNA2_158986_c0_seq1.p1 gnl/MRDRNA2_/MRDRNA2_158986_c0~~gnl/MRDRNA2_/MRDRNA2_158986_c0_seq1.p1  ORF type:complete len:346 (-),score=89.13 gnl/MRDRNA2_/MRDRNA2_158986_c0_seq1:130-1083(-)
MAPKSQGLMAHGVRLSNGAASKAEVAAPTPQRERASSISRASASRGPKATAKAATGAAPPKASVLRAAGEAALKKVSKSIAPAAPRTKGKVSASEIAAATRIQALIRGRWARMQARRMRQRRDQLEEERRYHEEAKKRREEEQRAREEAAAEKKRAEAEKRQAETAKREQALRSLRDRKSTIEIMCQTLPKQEEPWEEDPELLVNLLDNADSCDPERILGKHQSKRTARKRYLALARRWHPDKWGVQGAAQVDIATEVTKLLCRSYERMRAKLPAEASMAKEDEDEETEANEFASFFGVSFEGMADVYNSFRRVKNK